VIDLYMVGRYLLLNATRAQDMETRGDSHNKVSTLVFHEEKIDLCRTVHDQTSPTIGFTKADEKLRRSLLAKA
jgi:hypothetical protein